MSVGRNQRRAAKKRSGAIFVSYGFLLERDQNYGLPVACYVCGAAHKACGLARIQDQSGTTDVALCERHIAAEDAIIRKFLNAPDLEINKGGEATTEQVLAMAEKQDAKQH